MPISLLLWAALGAAAQVPTLPAPVAFAGDPGGRAKWVHRQTGGTCALVAIQQVFLEAGMMAKAPPGREEEHYRKQEDALYRAAVAEGLWRGGRHTGGMDSSMYQLFLSERGMDVTIWVAAKPADLDREAGTGRMLLVEVDAGKLWGRRQDLGLRHVVTVTGTKFDAAGVVQGFWINDSGAPIGTPLTRYVTRSAFLRAWSAEILTAAKRPGGGRGMVRVR